jgi:hypothetical protein
VGGLTKPGGGVAVVGGARRHTLRLEAPYVVAVGLQFARYVVTTGLLLASRVREFDVRGTPGIRSLWH